MANTRAIMAVGEAIANLLRAAYDPADFTAPLEFRTVTSRQITNDAPAAGVTLLLYRVTPSGIHRSPVGRTDAQGRRFRTQLPVDAHFLLSFWGTEPSLQNAIAGWAMRTLEDSPLLGSGVLNAAEPGTFRAEEAVELALAELANEDLLRIWEVLNLNVYQLSVPYVARMIKLESVELLPEGGGLPVQERCSGRRYHRNARRSCDTGCRMIAPVTIREIERIRTFTALGFRFWDRDFAHPVSDGITATARPWGRPDAAPVNAVRTFSGALGFHGLPGLKTVENEGLDAPLGSPPTRRYLIEITDTKRRYASAALGVDLPLPYTGHYVGPTLPSPPPPGFFLVTGPDRPRDPALARINGEIALAATGAPAAWAVVNVTDPASNVWSGIANAEGRFSVTMPWPALEEVIAGSPPTGAASSLLQRSWTVDISVQAAATALTPITSSGVPDYSDVLGQPATDIWPEPPDASPTPTPTATLPVELRFGETLVLRSGTTSSRLLVGAAPPSSP